MDDPTKKPLVAVMEHSRRTVNAATARLTMIEAGFNPIAEALKRYNDPTLSERTHNEMLRELLARWSPTLKAIEITDNTPTAGNNIIIQIQSVPSPVIDAQPTIQPSIAPRVVTVEQIVEDIEEDDDGDGEER